MTVLVAGCGIRETAGTLYFETSPDKSTWSLVHQLPTPFAVDDVEIRLQGSANTATTADTFSFDDLDL
ncbi:MAG TPA: hypothetical protein VLB44_17280 [Kofleriaceae bacterium]|nr:hypothetical protein [Kofleriaceae bacterium]